MRPFCYLTHPPWGGHLCGRRRWQTHRTAAEHSLNLLLIYKEPNRGKLRITRREAFVHWWRGRVIHITRSQCLCLIVSLRGSAFTPGRSWRVKAPDARRCAPRRKCWAGSGVSVASTAWSAASVFSSQSRWIDEWKNIMRGWVYYPCDAAMLRGRLLPPLLRLLRQKTIHHHSPLRLLQHENKEKYP